MGIEDDLQVLIKVIKTIGWADQRPWSEFFQTFKPPKKFDQNHIMDRATTNLLYYRTNYILIGVVLSTYTLLMNPILTLILIITVTGAIYVATVRKAPIIIGTKMLSATEKGGACAAVGGLILFVTGQLVALLWTFSVAIIVVALHCCFRPRTLKSKVEEKMVQGKLSMADVESGAGFSDAADNMEERLKREESQRKYAQRRSDLLKKKNAGRRTGGAD